jgi:putative flavoprotein involved in K+ transport
LLDNHVTNISEEVRSWLLNFNKAISNRNNRDFSTKLLKDLFFDDSHWRDILALTWKIQTFSGSENISQLLYDTLLDHKADGFIVNADRTPPREVTRGGKNVIEAILKFKTKFGECDGIVRLYQDREDPTRFRAWSLLTALHELNSSNNLKDEVYKNSFEGPNWLDIRNEDKLYKDRDPEVIVVGSGQAGLSIAARLKQQNIDTLIVDKNDRVGDNWRNRYHSLKLHNQTHVNHLPYMPFPSTWPTYIPKDKLAGWFEYYAESMELNVWTQTTFLGAEYNEVEKKWIVNLKLSDGNVKIMKPKHIVMAIGVSSVPNRTNIPGTENYKGKIIHSTDYNNGKSYKDKNILVFGTGTSAHDVAQDLYVHGANVKVVNDHQLW